MPKFGFTLRTVTLRSSYTKALSQPDVNHPPDAGRGLSGMADDACVLQSLPEAT